jgi:hypothetical protein
MHTLLVIDHVTGKRGWGTQEGLRRKIRVQHAISLFALLLLCILPTSCLIEPDG